MKKKLLITSTFLATLLMFSALTTLINAKSPVWSTPVWSTPVQLTTHLATDTGASISQDSSGKIWVFFTSNRLGTSQIWYMMSVDQGATWSLPLLFPPALHPAGASSAGDVCLFEDSFGRLWAAWGRSTAPSEEDLYFSVSDDLGVTWSDTRLIVGYPDDDSNPCFVEVNNEVWLVFRSWGIAGNWNIYYIKTVDRGLTWSSPPRHCCQSI